MRLPRAQARTVPSACAGGASPCQLGTSGVLRSVCVLLTDGEVGRSSWRGALVLLSQGQEQGLGLCLEAL